MDHRDAMSEFGTHLKSLPEFEMNLEKMIATFVDEEPECDHDLDCDQDPDCKGTPLEPKVHTIHLKWEVCGTCEGKGSHVNPSIDAHGLSHDDFEEDPGFEEDYFSGVYDVKCYECGGRTTSPAIDEKLTPEETLTWINEHFEYEASYQAEVDAERRMGA